jgi:hypothetical protein
VPEDLKRRGYEQGCASVREEKMNTDAERRGRKDDGGGGWGWGMGKRERGMG